MADGVESNVKKGQVYENNQSKCGDPENNQVRTNYRASSLTASSSNQASSSNHHQSVVSTSQSEPFEPKTFLNTPSNVNLRSLWLSDHYSEAAVESYWNDQRSQLFKLLESNPNFLTQSSSHNHHHSHLPVAPTATTISQDIISSPSSLPKPPKVLTSHLSPAQVKTPPYQISPPPIFPLVNQTKNQTSLQHPIQEIQTKNQTLEFNQAKLDMKERDLDETEPLKRCREELELDKIKNELASQNKKAKMEDISMRGRLYKEYMENFNMSWTEAKHTVDSMLKEER
ncbi:hypothetical protein DFH28DRAFT_309816 [Melampsora americana]|nr:hypothetical protein DFH28DRAFT_309816 [Melampsora americana]